MPDIANLKIFKNCQAVYAILEQEHELDELRRPIFKQAFGKAISQLGINPGLHTAIRNKLINMGCMEVLEPAIGRIPATLLLVRPPTPAIYNANRGRGAGGQSSSSLSKAAHLEEAVIGLTSRVRALENEIENLCAQVNQYQRATAPVKPIDASDDVDHDLVSMADPFEDIIDELVKVGPKERPPINSQDEIASDDELVESESFSLVNYLDETGGE